MINTETLRAYLRARGLSQAELARRAGVTRQAVSAWLRAPEARVRGETLLRVAEALGLRAEVLARPLPMGGADREALTASLLWDRLYPDLIGFAIAVNRREPEAIARLVQVHGLFAAERLVGSVVWKRFPAYKRFIVPARRRELETLYEWKTTRSTPTAA